MRPRHASLCPDCPAGGRGGLAGNALPARADDLATVGAKVGTAMHAAKSFVADDDDRAASTGR